MKEKKIVIGLILVLCFILIGCSQKTKYFEFDNDIGMITSYTGDSEDIVIPSEIDGVEVTKIGDYAFDIHNFTSVEIPDSVTEIGDFAFSENNLESIEIGDNVELGSAPFTYRAAFQYAYKENNMTSGTYIKSDNGWELDKGLLDVLIFW